MTDNATNPEQSAEQTNDTTTSTSAETPETSETGSSDAAEEKKTQPSPESTTSDTASSEDETGSSPATGPDAGTQEDADASAQETQPGTETSAESSVESAAEAAEEPVTESSPANAGEKSGQGENVVESPATDAGETVAGTDTEGKETPEAPSEGTETSVGAGDAAAGESDGMDAAARAAKAAEEAAAAAERAKAELEAMRPVWEELTSKKDSRETFEAKVTGVNRGGIVAEYQGVEVFVPQSHWSVDRSADVDPTIVGNTFEMHVLEITQFDTDARRVTGTRRSLLRKELLASLEPGMRLSGRVSTLTDFGAFVDIGGVDGLLHVSEISHARSAQPKDLLKKGEEIEVVIKKIEKGGKRISLGRKELLDSPWKGVSEKYQQDTIVTGTVVSLTDIGAFVQLEPGVDGLVRPREMSWTKRVNSASDMLKIGEKIEVMILSVNEEDERIGLSLKRAGENPWPQIVERFSDEKATYEAEVREVSNKGAVVSVEGVEGFLPRGRMGRESNRLTELSSGDKLTVRVVEVDTKRPSVIFGLPMAGGTGGGGGGRGGDRRGGGGGGGRGRGGRDFQAPPAEPSNEIKSSQTVSNFSLGDMLAEVMKEKLGVEEEEKKAAAEKEKGEVAKEEKPTASGTPEEKAIPVETADPSSETVNAPLSPAEFGTTEKPNEKGEEKAEEASESASSDKPDEGTSGSSKSDGPTDASDASDVAEEKKAGKTDEESNSSQETAGTQEDPEGDAGTDEQG